MPLNSVAQLFPWIQPGLPSKGCPSRATDCGLPPKAVAYPLTLYADPSSCQSIIFRHSVGRDFSRQPACLGLLRLESRVRPRQHLGSSQAFSSEELTTACGGYASTMPFRPGQRKRGALGDGWISASASLSVISNGNSGHHMPANRGGNPLWVGKRASSCSTLSAPPPSATARLVATLPPSPLRRLRQLRASPAAAGEAKQAGEAKAQAALSVPRETLTEGASVLPQSRPIHRCHDCERCATHHDPAGRTDRRAG